MKPFDRIGMEYAKRQAISGTCNRLQVGAVIMDAAGLAFSTGFNTSIAGFPTCDEVGHQIQHNHCIRTVHAEVVAICAAARHGLRTQGATIYVTALPCWNCFKTIVTAGIKRIVFGEQYGTLRLDDVCKKLGIELVHYKEST